MPKVTYRILFFCLLILAAAVFLWICRPYGMFFLADDYKHIPRAATEALVYGNHWFRPVSNLSFRADYFFWGMSFNGFYFTNIFFHLVNTVLVFFLSKQLLKPALLNYPALKNVPLNSSALFLVYASHSESIFWLVGRGGSLSVIFMQASLLFYLHDNPRSRWFAYCFFIPAFLTYELSWSLPLLMTMLDIFYSRVYRIKRQVGLNSAGWFIFFGLLCMKYFYFGNSLTAYETGAFLNFDLKLISRHFLSGMARVFIPPVENTLLFASIAFILLVTGVALYFKWKMQARFFRPLYLLLLCSMAICLLPVLAVGADIHDSEGERLLYSASVFFCIFTASVLSFIKKDTYQKFAVILMLCIQLFFLSQSSASYRYAGTISKQITAEVNVLPATDSIDIINLPFSYKGAPLFKGAFPKKATGIFNKEMVWVNVMSSSVIQTPIMYKIVRQKKEGTNYKAIFEYRGDSLYILR